MRVFKLITPSDRTESNTEVTRWVTHDEITEKTFDALLERLKRLFGKRSGNFFLSWYDGTDYCTIRDHHDLQDAVDFFSENDSSEQAVRIYVTRNKDQHLTIYDESFGDGQNFPNKSCMNTSNESGNEEHATDNPAAQNEPIETLIDQFDSGLQIPAEGVNDQIADTIQPNCKPTTDYTSENITHVPIPGCMTYYPTIPVNNYAPYALPYPYGNYYPSMFGQPPLPMQPQVQASMSNRRSGTESLNGRRSSLRNTCNDMSGPDWKMLEAINKIKNTTNDSTGQPRRPSVNVPHSEKNVPRRNQSKDSVNNKKNYINLAYKNLRAMGFTQDEKELKAIIKSENGNMNRIIDRLEKQSN